MNMPTATYRIQFNPAFGFKNAQPVISYLADLGISDLYASPIFKAVKGSTHGYDVVDPNQLNPELGGLPRPGGAGRGLFFLLQSTS